jgi:hypothetical protein
MRREEDERKAAEDAREREREDGGAAGDGASS